MSLPTALLKWRGVWVNGGTYNNYDVAQSPLTGLDYVLVNGNVLSPSVVDPSVGAPWVPYPSPSGPTGPTGPTGPPAPTGLTFQTGRINTSGPNGSIGVLLPTPYTGTYNVFVTMLDSNPAEVSAVPVNSSVFTLYWANAGGGNHSLAWLTAG